MAKRRKQHSWSDGIIQHCINPGCRWSRRCLLSAIKDGETKRRLKFVRDDGWVQRDTPQCESDP